MKAVIKTNELSKFYGSKQALDSVNLNVPKGSVYGLLGPNGAGKTTIIGILSGLIRKTSGAFVIDSSHARLGLLPQDADLYANMSALQHMSYFGRLQGFSGKKAVSEGKRLLKKVGFQDDMNILSSSLSHGYRRRLGIAQALIGSPEVVVFDEPTSGLDPSIAKSIRDLVRELKKEDVTVILSSHNLYEVEELCDQVGVLHKGKLVRQGSISKLKKAKTVSITAEGFTKKIFDLVKSKSYVKKISYENEKLTVEFNKTDKTNDLLKELINHGVVISKIKKGDSLEDIFISMVGNES